MSGYNLQKARECLIVRAEKLERGRRRKNR
jgi:hypothetical protein